MWTLAVWLPAPVLKPLYHTGQLIATLKLTLCHSYWAVVCDWKKLLQMQTPSIWEEDTENWQLLLTMLFDWKQGLGCVRMIFCDQMTVFFVLFTL